MEDEVKDVEVDSSTTQDVQADSSTADHVEATTQQADQQAQGQAIPYDRFKEVNDERNYWKEQFANLANNIPRNQPQPQHQVEVDPYANMDPQTRVFYQDLDKRTQQQISKVLSEKERDYQFRLDTLAAQNAQIQAKLFRSEQVDVVPGSQEEVEIASLIRMGVPPDKAAWAVMGEKRVESVKGIKKTTQQQKTQMKAQANVETSGVPTNSGVPTGEKLSFRQDLERRAKQMGF